MAKAALKEPTLPHLAWSPTDWGVRGRLKLWTAQIAHLRLRIEGDPSCRFEWQITHAETREIIKRNNSSLACPLDAKRQVEMVAARVLGYRVLSDDVSTKVGRRTIAAELEDIVYDIDKAFGVDLPPMLGGAHPAQCLMDELTDIAERLKE